MATNGQNKTIDNTAESTQAAQYLFLNSQDDTTPANPTATAAGVQPGPAYHNHHDLRPAIDVPTDLQYSMQRFVNPHAHAADSTLRQHHFAATTPPLTEDQSRARMAAILAATTFTSATPAVAPAVTPVTPVMPKKTAGRDN